LFYLIFPDNPDILNRQLAAAPQKLKKKKISQLRRGAVQQVVSGYSS
jgi:hypothetical protein